MSDRLWIHPRGGGAFTMSHKIRVNAGQKQIALPNKNVYDGPADVVLTDEQFARLRPALFPSVLTDLGSLADPDIDASFATDAELAAASTLSGLLAARPAANAGTCKYYFATDDAGGTLYITNGTIWTAVSKRGLLGSVVLTNGDQTVFTGAYTQVAGATIGPIVAGARPLQIELDCGISSTGNFAVAIFEGATAIQYVSNGAVQPSTSNWANGRARALRASPDITPGNSYTYTVQAANISGSGRISAKAAQPLVFTVTEV